MRLKEPVPNLELPYYLMEKITSLDEVPAESMPTGLRESFQRYALWAWRGYSIDHGIPYIDAYWMSREKRIIVVIVRQYSQGEIRRQIYLKERGGRFEYMDIIDPEVQDLIAAWLSFGVMVGKEGR